MSLSFYICELQEEDENEREEVKIQHSSHGRRILWRIAAILPTLGVSIQLEEQLSVV